MYATLKNFYVQQCDYQHWANEVLFASLDLLDDEHRNADEGLFFKSIHHTLDHALVVTCNWTNRMRGAQATFADDSIHHPDWKELKQAWRKEIRSLEHFIEGQPDNFLEERIHYQSGNVEKSIWARDALCHVLTHVAHHRGQITAIITRLGLAAPEMDFVSYKREMEQHLEALREAPATH
jgi:uncharacterized damage-inducible protein DinB